MVELKINFAVQLKTLRTQKDLTQQQLAEIVNVNKPHVSNWESGRNVPLLPVLWQLADYFQCSIDFLVGRSDNP